MNISPPKPTRTERMLLLLAFVMLLIMILLASFILRHPVAKGVGIIEDDNAQFTYPWRQDVNASVTNVDAKRTLVPIPDTRCQECRVN